MTVQAQVSLLISALGLPASCRVDQRVPKKMLIENGARTSADKRLINDAIEEIQWLAALKPNTVGLAEYRDKEREYLEIAVLYITMRNTAAGAGDAARSTTSSMRVAELVHRAVPYPVVLLSASPHGLFLSLAHKRWAQNEIGKVVLDGDLVTVDGLLTQSGEITLIHPFVQALSLTRLPQTDLFSLYQGWVDCFTALQAEQYTGIFTPDKTPAHTVARRAALLLCRELDARIVSLKVAAKKEKQMTRQVAVNLEIKALMAERQQAVSIL